VKFPRLESVEVDSSIDIPTYKIEKQKIKIADENISMSIETFKKIKEGDALKVKYLLKKLKVFMFGLNIMNEQVERYNKEFNGE
jgi:alpha-tubulin suppressor-like RCC1 family protein